MNIREATKKDWHSIWPIFQEIIKAGETYAYDPENGYVDALIMYKWLQT